MLTESQLSWVQSVWRLCHLLGDWLVLMHVHMVYTKSYATATTV